ncbi:MAG: DUF4404 family protein [Chromatiales bacterium]|nr:DUF4404 family protein [Chromatiales bacterium]
MAAVFPRQPTQGETMDQQRLQALLLELDRELKATHSLDTQSQELLRKVLADIPGAPAGSTTHRSAESRLRELMLRFEAEHPQLSGAVGQVADALGKLGI